jgi:catechol 2,3-dioxygenase-like lactoylglutathione lyase family enzyme
MAVLSDDPGVLADFYTRHFDLEELGRSNEGDISLTDGFYNVTFLKRRPELNELSMETGLHHVGLQVPDMQEVSARFLRAYADGVMIPEQGGLHFGEYRLYDPECMPVSISSGTFGVGDDRERRVPRIVHISFNSLNPQQILRFYSTLFGFREISTSLEFRMRGRFNRFAGDGVTNLAIHPFYNYTPGHQARYGFNHFGFLVDDMERRLDLLSGEFSVARRPEVRPYAEYRVLDPEGNRIDLSQAKGWEVDPEIWDKAIA